MVAMITGVAAFTASKDITLSLWTTLAGWFLAVGGFSLDFYADCENAGLFLDKSFPRLFPNSPPDDLLLMPGH